MTSPDAQDAADIVAALPPPCLPAPEPVREILAARGGRAGDIEVAIGQFIAILLDANTRFNLTGDADPARQWASHAEDALRNAALIEERLGGPPGPRARVADVGSGGGWPGMVWAILWPEAETVLIEATRKKADFLRAAGAALGLARLRVVNDRAERAGRDRALRGKFDLVTARALAPLATLAEWTLPLVRVGGRMLAIKGAEVDAELAAARRALIALGAPDPPARVPYVRSDGKTSHALIWRKTKPTPEEFPRRDGVARERPL